MKNNISTSQKKKKSSPQQVLPKQRYSRVKLFGVSSKTIEKPLVDTSPFCVMNSTFQNTLSFSRPKTACSNFINPLMTVDYLLAEDHSKRREFSPMYRSYAFPMRITKRTTYLNPTLLSLMTIANNNHERSAFVQKSINHVPLRNQSKVQTSMSNKGKFCFALLNQEKKKKKLMDLEPFPFVMETKYQQINGFKTANFVKKKPNIMLSRNGELRPKITVDIVLPKAYEKVMSLKKNINK